MTCQFYQISKTDDNYSLKVRRHYENSLMSIIIHIVVVEKIDSFKNRFGLLKNQEKESSAKAARLTLPLTFASLTH